MKRQLAIGWALHLLAFALVALGVLAAFLSCLETCSDTRQPTVAAIGVALSLGPLAAGARVLRQARTGSPEGAAVGALGVLVVMGAFLALVRLLSEVVTGDGWFIAAWSLGLIAAGSAAWALAGR